MSVDEPVNAIFGGGIPFLAGPLTTFPPISLEEPRSCSFPNASRKTAGIDKGRLNVIKDYFGGYGRTKFHPRHADERVVRHDTRTGVCVVRSKMECIWMSRGFKFRRSHPVRAEKRRQPGQCFCELMRIAHPLFPAAQIARRLVELAWPPIPRRQWQTPR